jgi:hypothetical protein
MNATTVISVEKFFEYLVPKGQATIAQQFIVGENNQVYLTSPARDE